MEYVIMQYEAHEKAKNFCPSGFQANKVQVV
jgi:hypothetical protein